MYKADNIEASFFFLTLPFSSKDEIIELSNDESVLFSNLHIQVLIYRSQYLTNFSKKLIDNFINFN